MKNNDPVYSEVYIRVIKKLRNWVYMVIYFTSLCLNDLENKKVSLRIQFSLNYTFIFVRLGVFCITGISNVD